MLIYSVRGFLVILLTISFLSASSQVRNGGSRKLDWKYGQDTKVTSGHKKTLLWFDGAMAFDEGDLPWYYERIGAASGASDVKVQIINAVYEPLQGPELPFAPDISALTDQAQVMAEIVTERKQDFVSLRVLPFRKNPLSGNVEKLTQFDLSFDYSYGNKLNKAWSFASESVLASGDWYRMNVSSTGIYQITYADLQNLGMNVSGLDPRNIRIHGNGGKMLPEDNSVYRPDDLQEIAIYVAGESDGVFNEGDYILFYATGIVDWSYDTVKNRFDHQLNKYSRHASYFITSGSYPGRRIGLQASSALPATYSVNTYDAYLFHEKDSLNLIKSGREWYGEVFDLKTEYTYQYYLPNIIAGEPLRLKTAFLARSFNSTSYFEVYMNGSKVLTRSMPAVPTDYTSVYASVKEDSMQISSVSPVTIRIVYYKGSSSTAVGWLNYFNLNYKAALNYTTGQLAFRNGDSRKKGISEFTLGNASGAEIWNVTDPFNVMKVDASLSGSNRVFKLETDSLLEFIAHNGSGYYQPQFRERVSNQNLHSMSAQDMIIVSHPDFMIQAYRLADHHRNADLMDVAVVTTDWVYNEFSSGIQDPTAIRSFMKMFYDRAGADTSLLPKYLMLFGDGSYDPLDRLSANTNFVVTWQTPNSIAPTASFLTDDYFGFLDDHEAGGYSGNLDIGIGRLVVASVEEAGQAVDKILAYASRDLRLCDEAGCVGSGTGKANLADWRNVLCFVADDSDKSGENFLAESEAIARKIDTVYPVYNIDKIYMDAYVQESTPGGQKYPDVMDAIKKRVEKGSLIMNYIGHGGEVGWAHESILTVSDINGFTNACNLPFFVTATCEFSRFDDPGRTSAGEYVFLNPDGGGIGLFTTTRLAFSGSNSELNMRFYNYVLASSGNRYPAMGDVVRSAKNNYGCSSVIANFSLLGDPALKLAYPQHQVVTTAINHQALAGLADTVKALEKVTVSGEIRDVNGTKLTDFNGLLFPMILDKKSLVTSRGNDEGYPQNFYLQKNIVYKGKASVTAGEFSFTFMVPKDIAYHYGKGKFSFYARTEHSDAAGYYNNFTMGGTENNSATDMAGPEIELYMNNERFVSGGITDPDPVLFAKVSDSSGMNTVGSGIGHDIAAVLDGNTDRTYVLNDYYESDLNTYQSGAIRYPFYELDEGSHTLKLKVWDTYNNSSERSIDFVVAESAELALDHVLNYPNPFTTYTEFWFEHNRPCCGLDVQVQIFTISGKLVKTISTWVQTNGYRAEPIPWDGLDDYGDPIGKGVYLYKLRVRDQDGSYSEQIEKLVILR